MAPNRNVSDAYVRSVGFEPNPHLPKLDVVQYTKSADQAADRLLTMHACAACVYGFPPDRAMNWMHQEAILPALTIEELECIRSGKVPPVYGNLVDSCWSLAWALGAVEILKPAKELPDNFVTLFPDIKVAAVTSMFRSSLRLRPIAQIEEALDIYYCLHNAVLNEVLAGRRSTRNLDMLASVQYQRHSLEWLVQDCEWDDVSLDT